MEKSTSLASDVAKSSNITDYGARLVRASQEKIQQLTAVHAITLESPSAIQKHNENLQSILSESQVARNILSS